MHDHKREEHTLAVPAKMDHIGTPLKLCLMPGDYCVELKKTDVLVGRHTEADVRLPSADVSRRHCRFMFTASGWQIVDLGSMNGIYVNDQRLERAVLKHGDIIRIGSCLFRVELGTGQQRQAS